MLTMIMNTAFQAYPLYFAAIPVIILGILYREIKHRKDNTERPYLEKCIYVCLCASILLTLAATCYSPEFFDVFDIKKLRDLSEVHFDLENFFYNILLYSLQGDFHAFVNWVGNMVLFMPIGFFSMWLGRNRAYKKTRIIILSMVFSILIELTQLCYGRLADVMDIILNTSGAAIGCYIFVYMMALTENLGGRYNKDAI